jgi:hypothetical protein
MAWGMKNRAKPVDGFLDGDLYLVMMAVQKLVDEVIPPDEMGPNPARLSRRCQWRPAPFA